MRLLLFSTLKEAKPTIDALKARSLPQENVLIFSEGIVPSCYEYDGGWIVLSGFGSYAAQLSVVKYGQAFDEIWNLGICGALNETLSIGDFHEVSVVGKYLPLPLALDPISRIISESVIPFFSVGQTGLRLLSSDFPIHDEKLKKELNPSWDLVDMEGYGVAFAAHHLGKKCLLLKIVSDLVSPKGRKQIHDHIASLAEKLAEHLIERELCRK